ncbi:hypothetical protein AVEN_240316-1 [Araneus ventricosus]|uniref:Uncharacterized protein n=1 Tax=Araneus ventricosus TaxID=182803 RepID=A0A4Y2FJH3_ARAVE|nr:hypothetical protein AVEN_240316-1 [Araneus ventricosus]
MQEKHVAQVTRIIPLVQINNTNRQQFTSNNSNNTFNSAQLTGFPVRTADETPKSFQSINTTVIQSRSFYTLSDSRDVTRNHLVHSSLPPLLIEISRKGSHFLESSICRQVTKMVAKFVAKVRDPGLDAARHSIPTPVKLSSQP